MSYTAEKIKAYLGKYKNLPGDAKIYHLSTGGQIFVAGSDAVLEISRETQEYQDTLHTFINSGNLAHYVLGTPETSAENPANATVKFGITDPHHHFIPHAHGVEHWVFSQGFSGCVVFDHARKKALVAKFIPGSMIYIPAMVPHMFYNRSDVPLITLIANGGLGIHHEKYAITKVQAETLVQSERDTTKRQEMAELAGELGLMEDLFTMTHPERDMSVGERISGKLYQLAEYVGASR